MKRTTRFIAGAIAVTAIFGAVLMVSGLVSASPAEDGKAARLSPGTRTVDAADQSKPEVVIDPAPGVSPGGEAPRQETSSAPPAMVPAPLPQTPAEREALATRPTPTPSAATGSGQTAPAPPRVIDPGIGNGEAPSSGGGTAGRLPGVAPGEPTPGAPSRVPPDAGSRPLPPPLPGPNQASPEKPVDMPARPSTPPIDNPPPPPAPSGPGISEPGPGRMLDAAPIDDLQARKFESVPLSYVLSIKAGLPGGCAQRAGYAIKRSDTSIVIAVQNSLPRGEVACTMIYGMYELNLTLDVEAGQTYTVQVNDKQISFVAR
jgi:hypothetical protein